jgi:hypothetical protein
MTEPHTAETASPSREDAEKIFSSFTADLRARLEAAGFEADVQSIAVPPDADGREIEVGYACSCTSVKKRGRVADEVGFAKLLLRLLKAQPHFEVGVTVACLVDITTGGGEPDGDTDGIPPAVLEMGRAARRYLTEYFSEQDEAEGETPPADDPADPDGPR